MKRILLLAVMCMFLVAGVTRHVPTVGENLCSYLFVAGSSGITPQDTVATTGFTSYPVTYLDTYQTDENIDIGNEWTKGTADKIAWCFTPADDLSALMSCRITAAAAGSTTSGIFMQLGKTAGPLGGGGGFAGLQYFGPSGTLKWQTASAWAAWTVNDGDCIGPLVGHTGSATTISLSSFQLVCEEIPSASPRCTQ